MQSVLYREHDHAIQNPRDPRSMYKIQNVKRHGTWDRVHGPQVEEIREIKIKMGFNGDCNSNT